MYNSRAGGRTNESGGFVEMVGFHGFLPTPKYHNASIIVYTQNTQNTIGLIASTPSFLLCPTNQNPSKEKGTARLTP